MRKAHELIADMQRDALKKHYMWVRLGFITNGLSKMISEDRKVSEIDWDLINEVLHYPIAEDDWNAFPDDFPEKFPISDDLKENYRPILEIWEMNREASFDLGPWRKLVCRDCGEVFYMNHSEVEFYKNKGLSYPKRCKPCREARKTGMKRVKPEATKIRVEPMERHEEHNMTAMEAAMRKAGLV